MGKEAKLGVALIAVLYGAFAWGLLTRGSWTWGLGLGACAGRRRVRRPGSSLGGGTGDRGRLSLGPGRDIGR